VANTYILTNVYRSHIAYELITDIQNSPPNIYYMFLGNHMPSTSNTLPQPSDDTNDTSVSAYRNMICGKIINSNNAQMMIRNIPWAANTAYAMWDDEDTLIDIHNFYAIVNAGAFSHVWKCLDNNLGANSTVAPDVSQISSDDISYRTADGYLWKYMASTPTLTIQQFGTSTYFPVISNSEVVAAAIPGAIDVITISNTGGGYTNWLLGTFALTDLRSGGNNLIYAVTGNSSSSSTNSFYTGCSIYISGGTGIGQYKTITDYFSNANGNFIVIDSAFITPPQNGSTYQIYPGVKIIGPDLNISTPAAARALINAVGNTVYRIDMLARGENYSYISANIVVNAVAQPILNASIRGIYAPYGGHGYNVYEELGATQVAFSVVFANNEANTIPATNDYQQIGILKDPQFANVYVNFSSQVGEFVQNEQVYTYSTRLLQNNVIVTTNSTSITTTNGVFTQQLNSGDPIILNGNSTYFWYTTVNAVTNDNFLTVSSAAPWACSAAQVSLAVLGTGQGIVTAFPGGNTIAISNVTGFLPSNTFVIGVTSGGRGIINNVSRNDVLKDFTTFVPMTKLVGPSVSGTFQPNEIVYMGSNLVSATSTGALHSVFNNSGTLTFYLSNTVGAFTEGTIITGANSGAVASLTTKYSPEISFGSSKILYLENINPVTRANNTSDQINIILTF
jgi:hypothetical protein